MSGVVPDPIARLLQLTRRLGAARGLDATLQVVVDSAVELMHAPRVSIRLFDPTHSRLIATCRAGQPMHQNPTSTYRPGEGLLGWIAAHGQTLRSGDAMADPRFVRRPDMIEQMGSYLGVPITIDGQVVGVLSAVAAERDAFTEAHAQLLELVAGIAAPHVEVGRLSRLAQVDALTGALNRHGLDAVFPTSPRRAETVSVVLIDVDHFKAVNDQLGHGVGDECLKGLARLLSQLIREEDALIRYGGEEFLLVLPNTALMQAAAIAERAREKLHASALIPGRAVTLSAGVAEQTGDETREQTIARADLALYEAKRQGRDRVVLG